MLQDGIGIYLLTSMTPRFNEENYNVLIQNTKKHNLKEKLIRIVPMWFLINFSFIRI